MRVRQTTDVRPEAAALLRKRKVPLPPKLHAVAAIPAAEKPQAWQHEADAQISQKSVWFLLVV